jgi:pimeloyl-ACP methyl ester carboxylesterase
MRPRIRQVAAALAALSLLAALGGALREPGVRRRAVAQFPMRGRLVDVGGGRRIQIDCRGQGTPTIVLEAGLDPYGALGWAPVHDSLAAITRTCAYSRAGILWSDPAPGRFRVARAAADLHQALLAAGERAPLVMVGHSIGAPYVMTFAARYPADVAALAFIDGSHPAQVARLTAARAYPGAPVLALVQVASRLGPPLAAVGALRLVPHFAGLSRWPAELAQRYQAIAPGSVAAMLREARETAATLAAVARDTALGDRPLLVMTALRPRQGAPAGFEARRLHAWGALHDDATRWSSRGRQVRVRDAGHYIHHDQPGLVTRELARRVAEIRRGDGLDDAAAPRERRVARP